MGLSSGLSAGNTGLEVGRGSPENEKHGDGVLRKPGEGVARGSSATEKRKEISGH